ncbi:iron ABC transporter substrate-binding protein [Lysinibacillus yapensis]|uniref:Iron ABC transporter substrate-binding protein n=1 Tax=Ureibacillus yapensis TaxID=2304605 RepID=A0A396S6C8_9BACL|nr:helical backbone metal receptor [Lysinibacillus yapensis]RHW35871.1 iron ABC transporter substrate-binding protein [Lysinibacillus yapensis]
MQTIVDHLSRTVKIPDQPKRIISICPAITETIFSLKAGNKLIGRTRYCTFPKGKVENIEVVGGTKEVNIEKIKQLEPDLILAEKEENTAEIVQQLEQIAPVFVSEVQSIQDGLRLIETLGQLTSSEEKAATMIQKIKDEFDALPHEQLGRAAYAIWRKPYMVVGDTTYINDVLKRLGFQNAYNQAEERYPAVSKEQLSAANLDFLFLASEPFPFSEKHLTEFQAFLPDTKILLVDGEMFWYGAKMIEAAVYFKELIKTVKQSR